MNARAEERARLRNALETCRREASNILGWNQNALYWEMWQNTEHATFCRTAAARAAEHAERAARAYFKGR